MSLAESPLGQGHLHDGHDQEQLLVLQAAQDLDHHHQQLKVDQNRERLTVMKRVVDRIKSLLYIIYKHYWKTQNKEEGAECI